MKGKENHAKQAINILNESNCTAMLEKHTAVMWLKMESISTALKDKAGYCHPPPPAPYSPRLMLPPSPLHKYQLISAEMYLIPEQPLNINIL